MKKLSGRYVWANECIRRTILFSLFAFLWIPLSGFATSWPVKPTIAVYIGIDLPLVSPPKPRYFRTINPAIVWVEVDTTQSAPEFNMADVYVGAVLPDGRFASWVKEEMAELILKVGAAPVPLMKNVSLQTTTMPSPFRYQFTKTDPLGFYLVFALLVRPGSDPFDTLNWIDDSTVVFTLNQ